jgi:hypothetical protein
MARGVTAAGLEQRRNWRYACHGNVSLYDLITQKRVPGEILDLSVSGCLVRPNDVGILREGDVIEVSFSLHGYSIRVNGCIRNIRPDQSMGIEFRGRNDTSTRMLTRLLQELAEEWMRNQRA